MALAHLANRDEEAPVVRYLALRELCGVVSQWAHLLEDDLVARAQQMADQARIRTRTELLEEPGADEDKADAMLDWFEQGLVGLDRGVVA
jgi:hypothetical protein